MRPPLLRLSGKGGVTLSRMKGSHYLVISYFRAPRLPLRSRATGERARQTEAEGKKGREREVLVQLPALSGWRVIEEEEGKNEWEKEGQSVASELTFLALSHFYLCPPTLNSPFDSPLLPPLPSFLSSPCLHLRLILLSAHLSLPRWSLTWHDDRLIHPLLLSPPPTSSHLHPTG